jgi:hypothetical protein
MELKSYAQNDDDFVVKIDVIIFILWLGSNDQVLFIIYVELPTAVYSAMYSNRTIINCVNVYYRY